MDQDYQIIVSLPVGGAGCDRATFTTKGVDMTLAVTGAVGEPDGTWLAVFKRFVAFRFRDEMHSFGFLDASYDALCELLHSSWITEMDEIRPPNQRYVESRHFVVMLSNVGYFEILAESVELSASTERTND